MQLEERVTIGQRHTRRIRNQANRSATPDARQDSLDHVATGAAPVASRRPAPHRDTRSRDECISLGMLRLPHIDRAMTSQREITRRSRSILLAPHIRGVSQTLRRGCHVGGRCRVGEQCRDQKSRRENVVEDFLDT